MSLLYSPINYSSPIRNFDICFAIFAITWKKVAYHFYIIFVGTSINVSAIAHGNQWSFHEFWRVKRWSSRGVRIVYWLMFIVNPWWNHYRDWSVFADHVEHFSDKQSSHWNYFARVLLTKILLRRIHEI